MQSSVPWWRLRQVALVAADLDAVEAEIGELLGLDVCFRDPGVAEFGLRNALWAVGDTFLEVVSPTQDETTAGRYLERRGGDSGYMVILQTDDLDGARARVDAQGVRVVYTAQGPGVTGLHLHPRDAGGAILSLDRCDDPADWPWAGRSWRDRASIERVADLVAVDVAAEDPDALGARWSAMVGLPLRRPRELRLGTGAIRFVPAGERGEGVEALDIRATDRSLAGTTRRVCGTDLRFV